MPTARACTVPVQPGFVRHFENWSADLRERLRRYQISLSGGSCNFINYKGEGASQGGYQHEHYWQKGPDEFFTKSSTGRH